MFLLLQLLCSLLQHIHSKANTLTTGCPGSHWRPIRASVDLTVALAMQFRLLSLAVRLKTLTTHSKHTRALRPKKRAASL